MPDPTLPIRILELRSALAAGGGPEKTILLGAAHSDPSRFSVTVCYLRDNRDSLFAVDDQAHALNVDYLEIRERHSFDPTIWSSLLELVRTKHIDIVHAHDYKTDFLALALAWRTGITPVATAHGWSGASWRERIYYAVDKRLLARFPAVIAVSEPIRQSLVARGAAADRVYRISNGIDPDVFRRIPGLREQVRRTLGVGENDLILGAVGRLEPEKRFELLLQLAPRIRRNVHVVLVGDGRCRSMLESVARSSGIIDRTIFTGLRRDVRDLLQAFDVYVQTSDTEGIPNAVLEAMATEVPVVATDVGGTRELVTDCEHGLLVPAGDVDGLAEAVMRTIEDRDATRTRVKAARRRVEQELSFRARMARVEAVYVSVLNRPAGRARVQQ